MLRYLSPMRKEQDSMGTMEVPGDALYGASTQRAALNFPVIGHRMPVDVFQTGSARSTNMNVNEVTANRCSQLAGQPIGSCIPVHPNDHCNLGQSSNDTMPSALHMSVALELRDRLKPVLRQLECSLNKKAKSFRGIVKIGRTHLMPAKALDKALDPKKMV